MNTLFGGRKKSRVSYMAEEDSNQYSSEHTISFTEKAWYENVWEYCKEIPNELSTFATVVVSMWAVAEVVMRASGERVSLDKLAIPILVLAVAVLLYRTYRSKREYVPDALVGESETTKSIFRKQKCGWSAALAKRMLEERIQEADAAMERIDKGSEFIAPTHMDDDDYFKWLQTRPELMLRMVRSAALLCTQEVPVALSSMKDEGDLPVLKREVLALAAMYESAKDAEAEWHGVIPPDEFADIHEMVYGWTTPIRNGVRSFLEVLDTLAKIDRRALKKGTASVPSFNIVFEEPKNIDEFSRRLDQYHA